MGYRKDLIPDAPMPISMLPTAETLASDDIIYIVKPNNPAGQRCKKTTVGALVAASGLVIVNSNDTEPRPLYAKLNDSTTIVFQEDDTGGHYRVKAFVKHGSIGTDQLADNVKRAKVDATPETSVVPTSEQTYATMATITTSCVSRLVDVSVRFQVSAVTPELSDTNDHDFEIELAVATPGVTNFKVASKRINWKYGESHEVRLVYNDSSLTQQSSLIVRVKKTTTEGTSGTPGYWPGSPNTFVVKHIDVTGILP